MRSSDWADLPKHLLDSVLKRLPSTSDYMHFSLVCTSWNSVAKDNLVSKRIAPMLLTYSGKENKWNLCDITRDKVLDLQLELPKRRYFGFSKGWLITMDENSVVNLINPFSGVEGRRAKERSIIKLPALKRTERDDHLSSDIYLFRATISADPIYSKNCTVVIIYGYLMQLAFIRLDKDTAWTYIDEGYHELHEGIRNIQDVIYVEDKFFSLSDTNQLVSIAISPQFNRKEDVTTLTQWYDQDAVVKRYLVQLSDRKELLMIHRYVQNINNRPCTRKTTKFELFKLDVDRWTKITSIGDAALFLGENSSISLLASEVLGCLRDCIYFIHDYNRVPILRPPRDFGLYDIKNEKFLPIDKTQAKALIKMSNQIPIWVMPEIKL